MNKVALVGRLTRDPEIRYTPDNQMAITRFTVAVDRAFKRDGQQAADFLPIVVFGKIAENVHKYMGKGRLVSVSGRLQSRTWDDQEGKRHYSYEVVADEVGFLDRASDSRSQAGQSGFGLETEDFHPVDEEDDLPF
ncbi:single-stranded DNA-binding protein [Lutispora saccharofermentans]|uniref:Single-stranded DNA-binding protein n=1 Tax=Lutispora saccharofermentans TaxID=3024236 RepID=A0ABT1NK62_9FIRM|nr:single-stranded DNA-binding protein [Lutispora saccharofermentans]MCQ1531655.1 single-stranded DNA-binding protein [Lutispora saccharofermentans]